MRVFYFKVFPVSLPGRGPGRGRSTREESLLPDHRPVPVGTCTVPFCFSTSYGLGNMKGENKRGGAVFSFLYREHLGSRPGAPRRVARDLLLRLYGA